VILGSIVFWLFQTLTGPSTHPSIFGPADRGTGRLF
jgi:hypothetical protein